MASVGRPPKPIEHHRRTGRGNGKKADGSPIPLVGEVVTLPAADGIPPAPVELLLPGKQLWERVWTAGAVWISPATDMDTVVQACRARDAADKAWKRYMTTTDPADMRAWATAEKTLAESLSLLGFNPTARARLGVAEVKRVSALEELANRRAERG